MTQTEVDDLIAYMKNVQTLIYGARSTDRAMAYGHWQRLKYHLSRSNDVVKALRAYRDTLAGS